MDEKTIRLLLVEDDIDSGSGIKTILEKRGIVVTMLEDAEQAAREFAPEKYDIVVSDIRLKGMSGTDLLGRIRKDLPNFPVILITGYDSLSSAIQAVRLGAQDYILKPFENIDDVLKPIKSAVANHRRFLENQRLEKDIRVLWSRLIKSQEIERHRLARELHDQVGQALTAINLNLSFLRNRIGESGDAKALEKLDDTSAQVKRLGEQIRDFTTDLRPPDLDDYGLLAALHWYGEQFCKRTGVSVDVIGDGFARRLRMDVEINLFRIVQEALNNTAKHAAAKRATITLTQSPEETILTVSDDGIGFNVNAVSDPAKRSCWGMIMMRERAESVGGRLSVESSPGKGTTVLVETNDSEEGARAFTEGER